jgi:hypothetical protein
MMQIKILCPLHVAEIAYLITKEFVIEVKMASGRPNPRKYGQFFSTKFTL